MRFYCVHMQNTTSPLDDVMIKLRAKNKQDARQRACAYTYGWRFTVGNAYTTSEVFKQTGWRHTWCFKKGD